MASFTTDVQPVDTGEWILINQHPWKGLPLPFLAESGKLCVGDVHKEMTLPEQQSPGTRAKAGQLLFIGKSGVLRLRTSVVLQCTLTTKEKNRKTQTYIKVAITIHIPELKTKPPQYHNKLD